MDGAGLSWDRYAVTWASLHEGYDPRHASVAVRTWLWLAYRVGRLLARRVTPMTLTVTGLVLSLLVPGAAWLSGPWFAAALVVLAAVADTLDGAVAVLTERTTKLGYLYDSVADRVAELCWLAAFWVLGAPVWLLVICGGLAWLHEYVRARAVAVGLTGVGSMTVGERTARLSVTLVGLVIAGLAGRLVDAMTAGTVTVAAVVWLFLAAFGLVQLLGGIRKTFG